VGSRAGYGACGFAVNPAALSLIASETFRPRCARPHPSSIFGGRPIISTQRTNRIDAGESILERPGTGRRATNPRGCREGLASAAGHVARGLTARTVATATLPTPRKRSSALRNAGPGVDAPAARAGQRAPTSPGTVLYQAHRPTLLQTRPCPGHSPPRHGNPGSTTEPGERQRVTFGPSPPDQHPPPSVASTGPAARCGGIPDPIRPTLPGHRDRAYLGVMTAQSYPRDEGVPGCAGTGKPADRRCRIRSALPGRPADRTCSARTALPGKPADRPCSARSPLRWAIQGRG